MTALLGEFNYLREIILATSAVHVVTLRRCRGLPHHRELVDALAARSRATRFLCQALEQLSPADKPIAMIAVAFFINFDLIDSGRGQWKTHIEAAGSLIASIQGLSRSLPPSFVQLADSVVADCITYHILGAGFASPADPAMSAFDSVDVVSTLQRGAAFSYGCSPPVVLDALLRASRLSPDNVPKAVALLQALRGYDTRRWVYDIPGLSPDDDLELRVSMADAHRVATILYVALAVPGSLSCLAAAAATTESVLAELVRHLAAVPLGHDLADVHGRRAGRRRGQAAMVLRAYAYHLAIHPVGVPVGLCRSCHRHVAEGVGTARYGGFGSWSQGGELAARHEGDGRPLSHCVRRDPSIRAPLPPGLRP